MDSMGTKCRLSQDSTGHWVGRLEFEKATLDGWIRLKFRRKKRLLQYTGVQVDEIQISIVCGNMPPEMGGQLICNLTNGGLHAP
jgi:hypothetical protein